MNQLSSIGFGTDATLLAGYAQASNDRLGNFSLCIEVPNNGRPAAAAGFDSQTGSLYLRIKAHDGVTAPSGFYDVAGPFTVQPGGNTVINMSGVNSKRIGFFGSGNVKANISVVIRNPAQLAGQSIDLVNGPRAGWGFQDGTPVASFISPGWPVLPNNSN